MECVLVGVTQLIGGWVGYLVVLLAIRLLVRTRHKLDSNQKREKKLLDVGLVERCMPYEISISLIVIIIIL